MLVAPCVLAWRSAPAQQGQPSRGLGRALSLWSWGCEPGEPGSLAAATKHSPPRLLRNKVALGAGGSSTTPAQPLTGTLGRPDSTAPLQDQQQGHVQSPEDASKLARRRGLARMLSCMDGMLSTADSPAVMLHAGKCGRVLHVKVSMWSGQGGQKQGRKAGGGCWPGPLGT